MGVYYVWVGVGVFGPALPNVFGPGLPIYPRLTFDPIFSTHGTVGALQDAREADAADEGGRGGGGRQARQGT